MLDSIQRMSHRVRTAYGDFNITYGGEIIPDKFRHFMMGLSQRIGCATQLWSIISYIVFSALWTQGFGIYFVNSFTMEISQVVGFSYSGKCDMIQSDDDKEATHLQMQLAISEWEYLIIIRGIAWHQIKARGI